jgi:hypothetical protein
MTDFENFYRTVEMNPRFNRGACFITWQAATKNQDALIKAARVEALRDAAEYFSEGTNDITAFQLERMAKEIEEKSDD